jgi:hypothetical protein
LVLTLVPWVLVWKGPVIRERFVHAMHDAISATANANIIGQKSNCTTICGEVWLKELRQLGYYLDLRSKALPVYTVSSLTLARPSSGSCTPPQFPPRLGSAATAFTQHNYSCMPRVATHVLARIGCAQAKLAVFPRPDPCRSCTSGRNPLLNTAPL